MPSSYKVTGPQKVADTPPGKVVTLEALRAAGAPIEILVNGGHITPVVTESASSESAAAPKARKGTKKDMPTGQEVEAD